MMYNGYSNWITWAYELQNDGAYSGAAQDLLEAYGQDRGKAAAELAALMKAEIWEWSIDETVGMDPFLRECLDWALGEIDYMEIAKLLIEAVISDDVREKARGTAV